MENLIRRRVRFAASDLVLHCLSMSHKKDAMLLVKCLATDAGLTTDPGVANLIPSWSHIFVEIDHKLISTVIHLSSTESFKKGCCQFQAKVCAQSTGLISSSSLSRKKCG